MIFASAHDCTEGCLWECCHDLDESSFEARGCADDAVDVGAGLLPAFRRRYPLLPDGERGFAKGTVPQRLSEDS